MKICDKIVGLISEALILSVKAVNFTSLTLLKCI